MEVNVESVELRIGHGREKCAVEKHKVGKCVVRMFEVRVDSESAKY